MLQKGEWKHSKRIPMQRFLFKLRFIRATAYRASRSREAYRHWMHEGYRFGNAFFCGQVSHRFVPPHCARTHSYAGTRPG